MLHCVKLKWKLHLYTQKKVCGIQPVILTFNTKYSTHFFIYGYQAVEYYIILSTKNK